MLAKYARTLSLGHQAIRHMVTEGKRRVAVLIFDGFEVLDVYGPLEAFRGSEHFEVVTIAEREGPTVSGQGPATVAAESFLGNYHPFDILLVPGGKGTRREGLLCLLGRVSLMACPQLATNEALTGSEASHLRMLILTGIVRPGGWRQPMAKSGAVLGSLLA
ncbi:hypothetical protein WJX73_003994 [Symbiochloris irregularis]|uniref:DJ-1/PfpI domain-containing protein n=1 Tax=Symbiochloris irregularis TaxID=706552 RepID=A0AAW1NWI6_9CHLO